MFDLPDPFGPTTTQTPGSNSSVVLSAKDLKPFNVNDLRNNAAPSPTPIVGARAAGSRRTRRRTAGSTGLTECGTAVAGRRDRRDVATSSTRARGGPVAAPRDQPLDRRGRALRTRPRPRRRLRLRTQPPTCSRARLFPARVPEPHALHAPGHDDPHADGRSDAAARSHLACLAVERRAVREPRPVHDAPAARARLALAVVHLVVVLVLARAGRTGRRTARRRATSRGTSPRPAASRRSRGTGAGSPAATASRSCGPTCSPAWKRISSL